MNFPPKWMRKGRKRNKILSPVLQAAMTTKYIWISVSVVTREVGVEGAEARGGLALTLLLPLTLMTSPS